MSALWLALDIGDWRWLQGCSPNGNWSRALWCCWGRWLHQSGKLTVEWALWTSSRVPMSGGTLFSMFSLVAAHVWNALRVSKYLRMLWVSGFHLGSFSSRYQAVQQREFPLGCGGSLCLCFYSLGGREMKQEFLSRAWLLSHKLPTLPTSGPKELNILFSFST